LRDVLVDFKPHCFSGAEPRSTEQGTEHLLVPLGEPENPADYFTSEVRRVLSALTSMSWDSDEGDRGSGLMVISVPGSM
jgi:hypothetical protein